MEGRVLLHPLLRAKEEESKSITNNITRNRGYNFIFLIWVLLEIKPWDKNSYAQVLYLRSARSIGKGKGKKEKEGTITGGKSFQGNLESESNTWLGIFLKEQGSWGTCIPTPVRNLLKATWGSLLVVVLSSWHCEPSSGDTEMAKWTP